LSGLKECFSGSKTLARETVRTDGGWHTSNGEDAIHAQARASITERLHRLRLVPTFAGLRCQSRTKLAPNSARATFRIGSGEVRRCRLSMYCQQREDGQEARLGQMQQSVEDAKRQITA
jgi:hypothetical protein